MKSIDCMNLSSAITDPIIEGDPRGVIMIVHPKAMTSLIVTCIILQIEDKDLRISRSSGTSISAVYPNLGLILRCGYIGTVLAPGDDFFREFMLSEQWHFHMECPHCEKLLRPLFPQILNIKTPNYVCYHCGCQLNHTTFLDMLDAGKWINTAKSTNGIKSYYVNSLMDERMSPQMIIEAHRDDVNFGINYLGVP